MPLVAPVITAILPFSRPMPFSFFINFASTSSRLADGKASRVRRVSRLTLLLQVVDLVYVRPYFRFADRLNGSNGKVG
jgi:hypothetical protein